MDRFCQLGLTGSVVFGCGWRRFSKSNETQSGGFVMGFDGMSLGDVEIVLLMMLFLFVNVAEIHVFFTQYFVGEDVYLIHFIPNVSCASRIERY